MAAATVVDVQYNRIPVRSRVGAAMVADKCACPVLPSATEGDLLEAAMGALHEYLMVCVSKDPFFPVGRSFTHRYLLRGKRPIRVGGVISLPASLSCAWRARACGSYLRSAIPSDDKPGPEHLLLDHCDAAIIVHGRAEKQPSAGLGSERARGASLPAPVSGSRWISTLP